MQKLERAQVMDQHKEAFALMWYACKCGHMERMWNSRDGVTPFSTVCPSCDQPTLMHTRWADDVRCQNHKPHIGQRVWVGMTQDRARLCVAMRQVQLARSPQCTSERLARYQDRFEQLVLDTWQGGAAPDLLVVGYKNEV